MLRKDRFIQYKEAGQELHYDPYLRLSLGWCHVPPKWDERLGCNKLIAEPKRVPALYMVHFQVISLGTGVLWGPVCSGVWGAGVQGHLSSLVHVARGNGCCPPPLASTQPLIHLPYHPAPLIAILPPLVFHPSFLLSFIIPPPPSQSSS